jgi:hypothetical protein
MIRIRDANADSIFDMVKNFESGPFMTGDGREGLLNSEGKVYGNLPGVY